MVPESLQSIYQQYKYDTQVVASWLATTAKSFGYSGEFQGPTKTTSGRLKGKDRKKAKAAQVPITVPLAEHIVNASDVANIKLPNSFSIALERVIWVRKSFSERLKAAGQRLDQKSDSRHEFFADVLEKVRKTLQPLLNVDAFNLSTLKDAVNNVGTHKDKKGLSSLFSVLDVYEPSAAFEAAPEVVLPQRTEMEYAVEVEEDSLFEALFAMTTLMDDLSRLRIEITELWKKYEAGEMDIAAASVATNTAIELAQKFEAEISPLVEKHGGSSTFHTKYFQSVSKALGVDPEAKKRFSDDYNFAAYDTADALFANTLINIIAYVRANPLDDEIPYYNGLYGWYDEKPIRASSSGRENYIRMKPALLEMLSDLPLISNRQCPVEDQVTHGLMTTLRKAKREQKETPDVPIWFSFAAQIYLDTLDVVKVGKGWIDMQRVMRNIKQSVNVLPPSCPQRKKLLENMELWSKKVDPIALIRRTLGKPYKDYTFLRRHFLHCGLWVHQMRTLFHQQGVIYAAVPGTVLCTTQLYHALRQEKCLTSAWKDLDTLRKMQGNSTFFIGEPPTAFEGYFNNFCLTIGSSITNWAPNKRDKKLKVSKDNKPVMKFLGLTSALFGNRIAPSGDRQPVWVEEVEDWIQKGSKIHVDVKTEAIQAPKSTKTNTREPLIHRLAAAVTTDIPYLGFDYFAIHNLCRQVLLRLQTEEEKVAGPGFTRSYMSHGEHNLAFTVGFVFSTVAGKKDITTTTVSSTRLLEIATETFNQWLSEGNGSAITGTADEDSE